MAGSELLGLSRRTCPKLRGRCGSYHGSGQTRRNDRVGKVLSQWRTDSRLLGKVLGAASTLGEKGSTMRFPATSGAWIAPRRSPVRVRLAPRKLPANRSFSCGEGLLTTSRRSCLKCAQVHYGTPLCRAFAARRRPLEDEPGRRARGGRATSPGSVGAAVGLA